MDGMGIFVANCSKTTGIDKEKSDVIIRSMVRAVNEGALGSTNHMAQMARLKKKKFTSINEVSTIVANDTGYDREDVKKVCGWMVEQMIQTMNRGGMSALIRMVNLMKKGQKSQQTGKEVDYSDEVKDINKQLKDKEKNQ